MAWSQVLTLNGYYAQEYCCLANTGQYGLIEHIAVYPNISDVNFPEKYSLGENYSLRNLLFVVQLFCFN